MKNLQQQVIIGLLLGSLHLKKVVPPRLNSYAEYLTKLDNKLFCEAIYDDLKELCIESKGLQIKTRSDRKPQIKLVTKSIKELTELRKEFYNEKGKKIIPKTIDMYMSEEVLTMFYLDVGSIIINQYFIDVTKYTYEDCMYLAQVILQRVNIRVSVIQKENSKLYLQISDTEKMTALLLKIMQGKYLSYKYKILI